MTGRTPVYHVDRGACGVYRELLGRAQLYEENENGYVKWSREWIQGCLLSEWKKLHRVVLTVNYTLLAIRLILFSKILRQ